MRQFVFFAVAGGIAAVANFLSRILFSRWLDYASAIVLAYGVGMLTAFVLNRRFVFTNAANSLRNQMLMFCLVNVAAILQTLAVSLALAYYLLPMLNVIEHRQEIAHAIGVAVPIVTSYFGHRRWTFRPQR